MTDREFETSRPRSTVRSLLAREPGRPTTISAAGKQSIVLDAEEFRRNVKQRGQLKASEGCRRVIGERLRIE
jgi:hypothetical protein